MLSVAHRGRKFQRSSKDAVESIYNFSVILPRKGLASPPYRPLFSVTFSKVLSKSAAWKDCLYPAVLSGFYRPCNLFGNGVRRFIFLQTHEAHMTEMVTWRHSKKRNCATSSGRSHRS